MNLDSWSPTVRWSRPETDAEGTDLLVVLHGFGADENDLFPLTGHLPKNFTVAAVQAPKALPAHFGGYCWFPISEQMTADPADVYQAVVSLNRWVQERRDRYRTVSLLGFSQGMAMATSLMRINPGQL